MPIIKSAKKRVRLARKATIRNVKTKRSLRRSLKEFDAAAKTKKAEAFAAAQSELDTAVKKGLMHKNKAARKKQQLAREMKDAGVKPAAKAKPAAKTAAKPKAPAATKKPAVKKAPAKKPVASKAKKS